MTNFNTAPGQRGFTDGTSQYNALEFLVRMLMGAQATAIPLLVKGVNAAAKTVDAQPMVNQVDSQGVATPHGIIYGLPYVRLQGGANAVVLDPAVDDIGVGIFCMRDISSVKSSLGVSNPGSQRRFDMADGIYFGGILGQAPQNYVQFNGSEINIHSTTKVTMDANGTGFVLDGNSQTITTYATHSASQNSNPPQVPT